MSITPEPSGAYLRDLLGVDFTDNQLAIATHDLTPQLVVAGAGSGKTMVMAARVVHAVAFHHVAPGRILGLTFTNKAAAELASRVRSSLAKLPHRAEDDLDPDDGLDELPTVSTYNAYAAGIVRDHALRIGREPFTALLTEASQWQLAMRVVRSALGPFSHLRWATSTVAARTIALAGELAEHLVDIDAVRGFDARMVEQVAALTKITKASGDLAEAARARDELLTLVAAYNDAKERLDLIDYGDQVALAARIAQAAPAVGALERSRFALVVLDEYQDTGVAQRQLLSTLYDGGHPVTAVGDPNQAIYGWRGASVGNLLRFGTHFPRSTGDAVRPQSLMTSFRCGERILLAANRVATSIGAHMSADRRPPLNVETLAPADDAPTGRVVVARHSTDVDEAAWLAGQLADELANGTAPGDMAVLVRRRADFARLHRALVDRDIPVEVVGLGGLLEMPEVADVVATLSLLIEPGANAAAIRLLTGPRWRLGIRDLAALGRRAAHLATWTPPDDGSEPGASTGVEQALSAVGASVDPVDVAALLDAAESLGDPSAYSVEAVERLRQFAAELAGLRRLVGQPLVELVTEVVRTIGLDVEIEAEVERVAIARAANLAAFVDHAARFSGLEGESDLSAFLAYLEASADAENGLDAGAVSDADTVKLMTVHKAKGLEWDVVAVPGLVSDVFPAGKGRSPWVRSAASLPYPLRGDAPDLPALAAVDGKAVTEFSDECRADDKDEERRLAYVALTRARRVLLASGYCWSRTRIKPCAPSPYLTELADLGAPTVDIDCWCDDPLAEDGNPLAAGEQADVLWPAPIDVVTAERRLQAASLVTAAMAELRTEDSGEQLTLGATPSWPEQTRLILDELIAGRTSVREVPLPRRLTASQVVALADDPDALAQQLARPMPSRPVAQARRGSRFHAWVESRFGLTALLDTDDLPGAGDADLSDADLAELQDRFLASEWADRRPVAVEQPFELALGGRLVRGRIDAVYDADGGFADEDRGFDVIDYKTGAVRKNFAAASLQLSIYRLAWADLAGVAAESITAGFLYVRTGEVKRPDRLLSREELTALLSGTQLIA